MARSARSKRQATLPVRDPLWYKDAVFYEVHVRAFQDSNGDGIGDFPGLMQRLDYLQDLGVNVIWLLPFYPSPLRDDGYDIANYSDVHPDYGTLADFKKFLREAHRRNLRVVTELVINHTSDQHPWFQKARRAPAGSSARNFYVWSDTRERYRGTRIIFQDFEPSNWTWDTVAGAYYWHRFYSHQPDLNFDNPEVRRAVFRVLDFWLGLGVDGLRLDAVPYLFEREGTNCENLPETHDFLRELRTHVDQNYEDRMLLGEANMWPEDAVAYFGDDDECHMSFHFPLMPRLFMAIRMEDRFPIVDILHETPDIPPNSQWALFLRNHDELTLEMVTDEDRDYMYRVYASDPQARINLGIRRRLAPLLSNHRRKIELMNGLLLSLPGTPVIYYGDELGMGDNIYLGDRNGVRTPMQWSPDRNAGFSRANPQRLYLPVIIDPEYNFEGLNVEAQQNNPQSLLWWIKRLIALRRRYKAFGHGTLEMLHPDNRKVLAYLRRHADEQILVLVNLSRYAQPTELDLHEFRGQIPVELFGRTEFPPIGEEPYFFTLGPHNFYWFELRPPNHDDVLPDLEERDVPAVTVRATWLAAVRGKTRTAVETLLPGYLKTRRWFGGKARPIASVEVFDTVPTSRQNPDACLAFVRVEYTDGEPESYLLPLAFAPDDSARAAEVDPTRVVARLRVDKARTPQEGVLYEPTEDRSLASLLLELVAKRRRLRGEHGEVTGRPTRLLRRLWPADKPMPEPTPLGAEQSNTSLRFGQELIFKLYRKVDPGTNPDVEIGSFLTDKTGFVHVPAGAGSLEYDSPVGGHCTLGIVQGFVPNEGDAWRYTLDALERYWDRCLVLHGEGRFPPEPPNVELGRLISEPDERVQEAVGTYLAAASTLGQVTGELHIALASRDEDTTFAPERDPPHFRRSLYQSMRTQTRESLDLLRKRVRGLPETDRLLAQRVLEHVDRLGEKLREMTTAKISAMRIRCHGDFHLGQVLWTGKDFVVIDFEGEPARSISERRLKRSPLRDVAGMLRSFHYASIWALTRGSARREDVPTLEPWAHTWQQWVSATFLDAYLNMVGDAEFLPADPDGRQLLLQTLLIEKAAYELRYELNNRPDWVRVPLQGLLDLLDPAAAAGDQQA